MGTRPEVADIIRDHQEDFLRNFSVSRDQRRVLAALVACRTPALGGHLLECDACGSQEVRYHSCRDRHCPKCQAEARAKWFDARLRDVLPVPYFHVVFTLPEELRALALQNKKALYSLLFQASADTLLEIAADPKHLGARIGFHAILHTWGQTLIHHPHVHCVVPGGGLSLDGTRWVHCRKNFFLSTRVLRKLFRGKFLHSLRTLFDQGHLHFDGRLTQLNEPSAFARLMKKLYRKKWVVDVRPPFAGPETVLKYLARYTHRVAISNARICDVHDGHVTFSWKDYSDGSTWKRMTLSAVEFIRRFLLHVLPPGFVRIRHYGLLANRVRNDNLARCRQLLPPPPENQQSGDTTPTETTTMDTTAAPLCPVCKRGHLFVVKEILPYALELPISPRAPPCCTR